MARPWARSSLQPTTDANSTEMGKILVLDHANNFIHSEIDTSEADIYHEEYICKDDDEVRPGRSR